MLICQNSCLGEYHKKRSVTVCLKRINILLHSVAACSAITLKDFIKQSWKFDICALLVNYLWKYWSLIEQMLWILKVLGSVQAVLHCSFPISFSSQRFTSEKKEKIVVWSHDLFVKARDFFFLHTHLKLHGSNKRDLS